jgi:hypothetical protein
VLGSINIIVLRPRPWWWRDFQAKSRACMYSRSLETERNTTLQIQDCAPRQTPGLLELSTSSVASQDENQLQDAPVDTGPHSDKCSLFPPECHIGVCAVTVTPAAAAWAVACLASLYLAGASCQDENPRSGEPLLDEGLQYMHQYVLSVPLQRLLEMEIDPLRLPEDMLVGAISRRSGVARRCRKYR